MDDEIVIDYKVEEKNIASKKKKNNKIKKSKKNKKNNGNNKNVKTNMKKLTRRERTIRIILSIFLCLVVLLILINIPFFKIKNIEVQGNNRLSYDTVINLLNISSKDSVFIFNKKTKIKALEANAYVEEASISRKFPNSIIVTINEREVNYMLQFADSFVYINNQGYILDISNNKQNVPIIVGFSTDLNEMKTGNRINQDDLKKMNTVIKVYETSKNYSKNDGTKLNELISKIDISNSSDYILEMETEGKTIKLGDCSDLTNQMLYLQSILDYEQGKNGIIFLNMDLNMEKVYFREEIN